MSKSSKKRLINSHAKNYIQAVFAERLLEEGFKTPDETSICWYRVKSKEIINSICFHSDWNNLPLFMDINYGIHPLFVQPYYSRNVHSYDRPFDFERFLRQAIVENPQRPMTKMPYDPDAQVYAPGSDGRGIYTFNEIILPEMERVETIEDCYQLHKQRYLDLPEKGMELKFAALSQPFIDEVIYVDDPEIMPFCRKRIIQILEIYESKEQLNSSDSAFLDHTRQQHHAIFDGARSDYLKILENRKQKVIKMLEKKMGIVI